MNKRFKTLLWGLLALFVLVQLFRPARNTGNDQSHHISTQYPVSGEVEAILKPACYDCHSNYTEYPWYANIQPVAWWLANHVEEGKRELNFSAFTTRKAAIQHHKMEEVIEMVKEGEMPLASYTWVHRDAILSDVQKGTLVSWAEGVMDSMKRRYPPDSLVMKRRR